MDSILDQQRSLHEERERLEQAMVVESLTKRTSHKDKINADHRIKKLLDRYRDVSQRLVDCYQDDARRQEIDELRAPNELSQFYAALKQIKQFYAKHPDDNVVPMSMAFKELELENAAAMAAVAPPGGNVDGDNAAAASENDSELNPEVALAKAAPDIASSKFEVNFSDEEGYGRNLDLVKLHEQYLNLKGIERIDYLTYLDQFDKLYELPHKVRLSNAYCRYLRQCMAYLDDYCRRVKPLFDVDSFLARVDEYFNRQWSARKFPGWPAEWQGETSSVLNNPNSLGDDGLDLMRFSSVEELESLGLDRLKRALATMGLKCGGTLEQRAARLWQARGKSYDQLDASIKAKSTNEPITSNKLEIARCEAQIYRWCELLNEHRLNTIENVQRKQARTANERDESDDDDDALSEPENEDNDTGDVIYNPKNLPLGWDGKPIPYWLYKLHGLNMTYTCEICGDSTYKGPKAFQRHFADWRHAHGMRCLGIPNTAHFANITKIEDALKLWEKLKHEKQKDRFEPQNEEEYEDSQGNVVNKKTYEDLKRQGLL